MLKTLSSNPLEALNCLILLLAKIASMLVRSVCVFVCVFVCLSVCHALYGHTIHRIMFKLAQFIGNTHQMNPI